jgi:Cu(I)/Ag(I) efflux system membrane fusion protein
VRSPLNGIVAQLLVREGTRVSAGDPLMEVIDPAQVYAAATVPASALAGIHPGETAVLHLEGGEGEWPAEVESVGATVDSLSNTAQVLVRPRRYDPMLRPGLGVTVRVRTGVHREVLLVPSGALVFVGNTPTLFVVGADSIARARSVVVIARSGELVEVTGSVAAGDRVVTVGAYGLPDSAHVVPQEAAAP